MADLSLLTSLFSTANSRLSETEAAVKKKLDAAGAYVGKFVGTGTAPAAAKAEAAAVASAPAPAAPAEGKQGMLSQVTSGGSVLIGGGLVLVGVVVLAIAYIFRRKG